MITPTQTELEEYKILWAEFKDYKPENPKTHVDTETIKKIITPLPHDEPMKQHGERLIRYNRYLICNAKYAAYFFKMMEANNVTVTAR